MKKIILTTLLMVLIPLIGHAATYEITTPGNNIGIGSTSPGQALDVQGTVRASYFSGNFLSTGPIADVRAFGGVVGNGEDQEPAIAACLASGAGTCYLAPGVWTTGSTIVVPGASGYTTTGEKLLLDQQAKIVPNGNFNVVQLNNKARISGGIIDVSSVSSFISAMIYQNGALNLSNGGGADHIFLEGNQSSSGTLSTGIYLNANSASASIAFSLFHDITISDCYYGVLAQASSSGGSNYVNGNSFNNITIINPVYGVYLDGNNTYENNQVQGNMFNNLQVQTNSGTVAGIFNNSKNNYFSLVEWDVTLPSIVFDFTSTSAFNTLTTPQKFNTSGAWIDAGASDTITTGNYSNGTTLYNSEYLQFYPTTGGSSSYLGLNSSNNIDFDNPTGIISIEPDNTYNVTLASGGGNVGVGSPSPGSQLDVQGTIRVLGSGQVNIGTSLPTGLALSIQSGNGNVGIGTWTNASAAALTVVAKTNAAAISATGNLTNPAIVIGSNTSYPYINGYTSLAQSGTGNIVMQVSGGNIGIGSIFPSDKLAVNGGIQVNGNLAGGITGNVGIGTFGATGATCDSTCNSTNNRRCLMGQVTSGLATDEAIVPCSASITGICVCLPSN